MMQQGVLKSFALYNPYSTNAAHEQLTSKIRSCIEYLIPSGNKLGLV